ncbi:hypothetical protein CHGG_00873 [Chaetomium globosum CBS 148.51]|uniref:Uncharacterized protein n=1 Tax=Chaetomium globosum (strain ATCC 6205 / CBS 148.51 / DSM 1962 / NBRC 6347 / NRRL 1970) TaxID=306901 RepID=Q2HFY1_CHAGB|nr:uncharacterized protein CHGG_00873 [Chaetomium globosum CBS 148.51]EAQ92638.1 hypothetical protein CHGG_00873 [Chaetomium globosum CBS 148.51]
MARTTRSSVKREFPPESSWRMVEGGENDSFDTSILHDDDIDFIGSSGSQPVGSQQSFSIGGSSQPWSIGGSQEDSIENFLSKAEDDEQVLLRSPFRPSVPKAVRDTSRENLRRRSPEPELEPQFYMPKVDVVSPRRDSTRSSTTIRASVPPPTPPKLRRRPGVVPESPARRRHVRDDEKIPVGERAGLDGTGGRASVSLPEHGEQVALHISIRDLRTVVRYSSLTSKEELILEFDGFIDTAQTVTSVLQSPPSFRNVQGRKDDILWTLWTLVGANNRRLSNYNSQLALLKQVDGQRSDAVQLVNELIVELEKIQASLGDLKGRVSEAGLLRAQAEVPLSVHIETINKGVERLEAARSRIRSIEDERIKEVLARGKGEEKLIDA